MEALKRSEVLVEAARRMLTALHRHLLSSALASDRLLVELPAGGHARVRAGEREIASAHALAALLKMEDWGLLRVDRFAMGSHAYRLTTQGERVAESLLLDEVSDRTWH